MVGVQLYIARWDTEQLIPTQEVREAGDQLIAQLESIDGPIFSPHAPWYPVLAGKPPSAHLIAIWDIKHKGGPLAPAIRHIQNAMRDKKFAAVLLANKKEDYGRKKNYPKSRRIRYADSGVFYPKKGWKVRPTYLFFPAADTKKKNPKP